MSNMTENALELLKMQKRFTKWNVSEGYATNELPEWFRNAFRRAPHNTSAEDLALGVEKLLAWAEEHPEPRYPTWAEWWGNIERGQKYSIDRISIGDIFVWHSLDFIHIEGRDGLDRYLNESLRISSDMAELLGVEPVVNTP